MGKKIKFKFNRDSFGKISRNATLEFKNQKNYEIVKWIAPITDALDLAELPFTRHAYRPSEAKITLHVNGGASQLEVSEATYNHAKNLASKFDSAFTIQTANGACEVALDGTAKSTQRIPLNVLEITLDGSHSRNSLNSLAGVAHKQIYKKLMSQKAAIPTEVKIVGGRDEDRVNLAAIGQTSWGDYSAQFSNYLSEEANVNRQNASTLCEQYKAVIAKPKKKAAKVAWHLVTGGSGPTTGGFGYQMMSANQGAKTVVAQFEAAKVAVPAELAKAAAAEALGTTLFWVGTGILGARALGYAARGAAKVYKGKIYGNSDGILTEKELAGSPLKRGMREFCGAYLGEGSSLVGWPELANVEGELKIAEEAYSPLEVALER